MEKDCLKLFVVLLVLLFIPFQVISASQREAFKFSYEVQCSDAVPPAEGLIVFNISGVGKSLKFNYTKYANCASKNHTALNCFVERNYIEIREIFDSNELAHCICEQQIKGQLENLLRGKYTITFIYQDKVRKQTEFIKQYSFNITGQDKYPVQFYEIKNGLISKEEAVRLVQNYIRKQNINVKDINTPSEITERDNVWSISYAIEQEPVLLSPFRSFNVHKDSGRTYEVPRQ